MKRAAYPSGIVITDINAKGLEIFRLLTHTNGLMTRDPVCMAQPPVPQEAKKDPVHVVDPMGRHTFVDFPLTYTSGGAGLTSTIGDYACFAEMLLHEGSFRGREILRPDMTALMRTPMAPENVPGIGWSA